MSTAPITISQLHFRPLTHAPFIDNAVVEINKHFQLSISKNRTGGCGLTTAPHTWMGETCTCCGVGWWTVGVDDCYEVGIQALEPGLPNRSLVFYDGKTVTRGCNLADINHLADVARSLIYFGRIEVFEGGRSDKEPDWRTRFCYAQRVWPDMYHRFIPYVG